MELIRSRNSPDAPSAPGAGVAMGCKKHHHAFLRENPQTTLLTTTTTTTHIDEIARSGGATFFSCLTPTAFFEKLQK